MTEVRDEWIGLIDAGIEFQLGLVPRQLYDLAISGKLGAVRRRGRAILVSRQAVERFVRQRRSLEPA